MPVQATQDLNLPDAPETLVYRAVERVLKNDKVIQAITHTFVAWNGEALDLDEPTYSKCPYLRINPFPTESNWVTESQHDMPVQVRIQIMVRGTKFDNLANYWHAIRRAFFPLDVAEAEAVRAVLRGVDQSLVTKPSINMNAYSIGAEVDGLRMSLGEGAIKFGLLVRT
jgi:hypothetical protein